MFSGKTTPGQTKNIIIGISACLVIIGLYNILFFNRYLPITEGWYSVYAHYIREGAVPYRDFHFFLPPFIPLMTAVITEIFGESLFVLRILGIGVILAISTVLFFIYKRLFHAFIAALVTIVSVIFYQSSRAHITYDYLQICILFGLLGAFLILKFFDYSNDTTKRSMRWPAMLFLFLAGLFGALSFLTKQSNGLFIAAFSFLALLTGAIVTLGFRGALKSTGIYAAGFIIPILATVIWLYSNDALRNCWDQVFVGASSSKGGLLNVLFGWMPRNFALENIGGLVGILVLIFLRIYCFPKGFMLNTIGTTDNGLKYAPVSTRTYILFLVTFIVTGLCLLIPYWSLEFSYKLKDSYFIYFVYLRVIDISLIIISIFLLLFYFYQFVCNKIYIYINIFIITLISVGFMLGCGTSARIDLAGTFLALGMMLGYLFSIQSRFNITKILTIVFIMSLILFMASWKYIDPYNWWKLAQPDIRTGSTSLDVNKDMITQNDKLVLHFDVTDNSTGFQDETGKIITPGGNAHISAAEQKFGASSGSFDGQGDYLTIPNSADFDFLSEDFTIDGWFYFNVNNVGYQFLADRRGEKDQTGWIFYLEQDNSLSFLSSSDGAWDNVVLGGTGIVPETGNWMHLAIVRKGNLFTMYKNGIAIKAGNYSGAIGSQTVDLTIGAGHLSDYPQGFNGYIDEFRITKGIARWTTNFVPPALPYTKLADRAN